MHFEIIFVKIIHKHMYFKRYESGGKMAEQEAPGIDLPI